MIKKIKNTFLIILCLKLASCTLVNNKIIKPPIENYVKIFHEVTIISCKGEEKNNCQTGTFRTTGSGLAINISNKHKFGFILTAKHVCDVLLPESVNKSIQTNQIMDHKGKLHTAYVLLSTDLDPMRGTSDLCLMYSPTFNKRGVKLSPIAPKVGQKVYYMGSPAGVYHPPVVPIIDGIFSGDIDSASSMVTCAAVGGSSGSSVMNTDNKIIGLLFAAHPGFHHITIISTYKSLKDFIDASSKIVDSI